MANVCAWYLDLEGRCFLDEGHCLFPCDGEKCRRKQYETAYKPSDKESLKKRTVSDVYKSLEIKKGDLICTRFVLEDEIGMVADPYLHVESLAQDAVKAVNEKGFRVSHYDLNVVRRVEMSMGECLMIIAKGSRAVR